MRSRCSAAPLAVLIPLLLCACQSKELTSAKIYMQNNNWPKAVEQLEAAVAENPKNAEAHFLLGQAYGIYHRYDDMLREFDISSELSGRYQPLIAAQREQHWADKYNAAVGAQSQENYASAERDLKIAIKLVPEKPDAHKRLAFNYLKTGQFSKALMLYEDLLRNQPNDTDLLVSTANLYYSQKQYERVIAMLQRVLVMEPNHRDALANLALSYDALNQTEAAERAFMQAIAANSQDKDLIFLYAIHHYKQQNYQRAIKLFNSVLEQNPDDFESITNIGNAYLSMAEELKLQLKAAGNETTESHDILQMKSQIVLNYKQAIPYLEKALQIKPAQPHLWQNLGISYVNTGDVEKGEEAFLMSEKLQIEVMQ